MTVHDEQAVEVSTTYRATAYRYFPTPQSLLADTALRVGIPDERQVFAGVDERDPVALIDAAVCAIGEFMFREEAVFRNIVRVTVDRWFAEQDRGGDDPDAIRQTVRFRWIDHALAPLESTIEPSDLRRLRLALTLVFGAEALITTRDVCRLEPDEALEVMRWAAATLVQAVAQVESSI